jgi:hypothetical protein
MIMDGKPKPDPYHLSIQHRLSDGRYQVMSGDGYVLKVDWSETVCRNWATAYLYSHGKIKNLTLTATTVVD